MKQQKFACPSATNTKGSSLFGIVGNDGVVSFLPKSVLLTNELIATANKIESPETVFRYTSKCVEGACKQWSGSRCGVLDKVLDTGVEAKIKNCPIKTNCRWYAQDGIKACKICPLVITDMT